MTGLALSVIFCSAAVAAPPYVNVERLSPPTDVGFWGVNFDPGHARLQADSGHVVGIGFAGDPPPYGPLNRALRWSPGATVAEPLLPPASYPMPDSLTSARGIGRTGYAFGSVTSSSGTTLGDPRPARWAPDGNVATELGMLDSRAGAVVNGINAHGAAVGAAGHWTTDGYNLGSQAVRWDANSTTPVVLQGLGADSGGRAYNSAAAINSAGTAVGSAEKYVGTSYRGPRAMRWNADGTFQELGSLGVDPFSGYGLTLAVAINDAGVAAGSSLKFAPNNASIGQRIVRWNPGTTTPTELIDFSPQVDDFRVFRGMSEAGDVVALAPKLNNGSSVGRWAILWRAGSATPIELKPLVNDPSQYEPTDVNAVNDFGWSVGQSKRDPYNKVGVLWDPNGKVFDLSTFVDPAEGWSFYTAYSINNAFEVIALGQRTVIDGDGNPVIESGLVRILVPEPGALGILLLAAPLVRRVRLRKSCPQ